MPAVFYLHGFKCPTQAGLAQHTNTPTSTNRHPWVLSLLAPGGLANWPSGWHGSPRLFWLARFGFKAPGHGRSHCGSPPIWVNLAFFLLRDLLLLKPETDSVHVGQWTFWPVSRTNSEAWARFCSLENTGQHGSTANSHKVCGLPE